MKLQVESNSLRDALGRVLTVIDKKSSRPILTNCMFEAKNNSITLKATDLEVSTQVQIPADVEDEGTFCLNPKNLFDILKELPSENVNLQTEKDENLLKLICNQIRYSLTISGTSDFPQLTFGESGKEFKLSAEDLVTIINKTAHAISTDETRLYLNGIFLQEVNNRLRAVATDGHRLALIDDRQLDESNELLVNGIIIPRKGIQELKKLAEFAPEEELNFNVDESFLYVKAGHSYWISVRLIARDYPKYQAVIPPKTAYEMKCERTPLLNAVKRIRILANEKSNAVKFKIKKDHLCISANHPTLGDAIENLDVDYDGKEMEITFNAKYLIDTFSTMDDADVSFEFNNELSPVLVKANKHPDFLGIIMPLKV